MELSAIALTVRSPAQLDDNGSSSQTPGAASVVVEQHPRTSSKGSSMTRYRERLEAGEFDAEKREDDEQPVEQPDEQPQEQPAEQPQQQPDEGEEAGETAGDVEQHSARRRSSTGRKRSTTRV